jgi:hypothetical protein
MFYSLLIGLGAGTVSAVVFASATTGPLLVRMLLFLLTPLALFLAGLGLGPMMAALAGVAGTGLVLAAGGPTAAVIFAACFRPRLSRLPEPYGRRGSPVVPYGASCHRRGFAGGRVLDADAHPARRRCRRAAHSLAHDA